MTTLCSKCGGVGTYDEWWACASCNELVQIDTTIKKTSVLEVVRLWLNETVQFHGDYYPRRSFATATQLEDFLSERLK